MLQLRVAIRTHHQQVGGVVSDPGVKVVYLKVWFAVSLFEGERTNLTLPLVHFPKQDARSRWYAFTALSDGGSTVGRD